MAFFAIFVAVAVLSTAGMAVDTARQARLERARQQFETDMRRMAQRWHHA